MKFAILPLLVLALTPPPQTNDVIPTGSSTTLAWDDPAPGDTTLGYRLWCASPSTPVNQRAIVKNFSAAELTRTAASGTTPASIRATVAAMKDGAYGCHVTAWKDLNGSVLESDPSNTLALSWGSKPPAPSNLRRLASQMASLMGELLAELDRLEGR